MDGVPINSFLIGSRFGVVDIGGKTVDSAIFNSLDIVRGTAVATKQGIMDTFIKVSKQLKIPAPNLIESAFLNNQELYWDGNYYDVKQMCQSKFADLTDRIIANLIRNWKDQIERLEFIFLTGGGALTMRDYFVEKAPWKIIVQNDPQFANVKGYYKLSQFENRER